MTRRKESEPPVGRHFGVRLLTGGIQLLARRHHGFLPRFHLFLQTFQQPLLPSYGRLVAALSFRKSGANKSISKVSQGLGSRPKLSETFARVFLTFGHMVVDTVRSLVKKLLAVFIPGADVPQPLRKGVVVSQNLQTPRVGQKLADDAPHLLGHRVHGGCGLAFEKIHGGQKVLGTAAVLKAGDEL